MDAAGELKFGGATFDQKRDGHRLNAQLARVRSVMLRGGWLTLEEISVRLDGTPPASISARLRDLRKLTYGGYDIEKRVRAGHRGLWEYHMNIGGAHSKTASQQGGAP